MPTPTDRPLWRRMLTLLPGILVRFTPVLLAGLLALITRHWLNTASAAHASTLLPALCALLSALLFLACALQFWKSS